MSTNQLTCWRESNWAPVRPRPRPPLYSNCFLLFPFLKLPLYYSLFLHVCFSFFTYLSILEFIKLNPSGNVPVLVDGDTLVADSFAILMVSSYNIPIFFYISIPFYQLILHFLYYSSISQYLEDKYPHHYPLLPQDIHKRAINYQVLSTIYYLPSLLFQPSNNNFINHHLQQWLILILMSL